jgi:hypothetical protein
MAGNSRVEWEDVSAAAERIFRVWASESGKELDWANTAWIALGRAGLTSYKGGIKQTIVLLRFMTLGAIFREFCELAREEPHDASISDWAEALEISPVRVGQALGPHYLEDSDDPIKLGSALMALIDQCRLEVFEALVKEFGNESSLFLSLWRASEGGAINDPEENADCALNDITPDKMKAFEWVTEGMPSLDWS